jgi:EAL domain-containing protein (putative c-di-GMP-specific phosphodiesterase class I)
MPTTIDFNGFTLASAFQPIYGVRERRAVGFEALVRPTVASGHAVRAADLFLGLDEAETISLDRTCRTLHLRNFAESGVTDRMLFVNIHPLAAVSDARLARLFKSRIGSFGLNPERVCVEILEDCCGDEGLLAEAVASYREIGVRIAMDDFGAAHSNFDRVVALRPDIVKIDRSLLGNPGDENAQRMLPSVIDILHAAGARVVFEGIEEPAEATLAIRAGADFLQGFHFAMPQAVVQDDPVARRRLDELVRVRVAA